MLAGKAGVARVSRVEHFIWTGQVLLQSLLKASWEQNSFRLTPFIYRTPTVYHFQDSPYKIITKYWNCAFWIQLQMESFYQLVNILHNFRRDVVVPEWFTEGLVLTDRRVPPPRGAEEWSAVPSPLRSSCREGSCPAMAMVLAVLTGLRKRRKTNLDVTSEQ